MKSKILKRKIILSEAQIKNLIENLISEYKINESINFKKSKDSSQN